MSPSFQRQLAIFDSLPNDAVVFDTVACIVLGISLNTLKTKTNLPVRQITEGRHGRRVGDIRALVRGETVTA
jgi:hypothetical protein